MISTNTKKTLFSFAYNGMLKDDEIQGVGNSYTTFFREFDPRIGRWTAIDPKFSKLPHQSPYCSMDNNPIRFNDPMGDKVKIGSKEAQEIHDSKYNEFKTENGEILKDKKGNPISNPDYEPEYKKMFDQLEQDERALFIINEKNLVPIDLCSDCLGTVLPSGKKDENGLIIYNVFWSDPNNEATGGSAVHVLMEELYHSKQILDSWDKTKTTDQLDFTPQLEVEAKQFSGRVGGNYESTYLAPGVGFYTPTELGIIMGTNEENRGMNLIDYLTVTTYITVYTYIEFTDPYTDRKRKDKFTKEEIHNPTYSYMLK
jgi:RHS repeat-associated protein